MKRKHETRNRREQGSVLAVLGVLLAVVVAGAWIVRTYVFPDRFEPVALNQAEQRVFDSKLRALGIDPPERKQTPDVAARPPRETPPLPKLEPEPYREDPTKREIGLTERELNAALAHNTNLGDRLAIDLSDDLASAKLLIPMDPDFPVLGGRILRVSAGVELQYAEGRPVVILRGVSLMGVPIPNAWLGNLKHVDLVERFGETPGFWRSFAAGIDAMEIREGELKLRLRE
ncbi:MAG: arginine N-succinyltransferase [Myxococcota bacterium]